MKVGLLILSDKGAAGQREDRSGPALAAWLTERGARVDDVTILPDDVDDITATLRSWADAQRYDLILTCGGTGVSPRDVTPEATLAVAQQIVPGFGEVMRRRSLEKTPHALISRALAAIRGQTLIVNLPGSPRAAIENLAAVWDAVPHAIAKIQGDPSDCAGPA